MIFDSSDNSYTTGPEITLGLFNGQACTIFNSPLHGNRPVVFVAETYFGSGTQETEDHIQLLDYTLKNTWEYCKHDFRQIKVLINCKKYHSAVEFWQ